MTRPPLPKRSLGDLSGLRPKTVSVATRPSVRRTTLPEGSPLPVVFETDGADALAWIAEQRAELETELARHGGILLRGFDVPDPERFEATVAAVAGEALEYTERSSPRSRVQGNVYTSTDYPPDQPIFLHNENSYAHRWPGRIFFFCATAPESGGETPIADVRQVYRRLPADLVERFERLGVRYARSYSPALGLPWQTVFQTDDRAEVERRAAEGGYELEWRDGDRLRTRRRGRASYRHPATGELAWFNHATFFHVSTLPEAIRDGLLVAVGEEDLPNQTYYGDGSPIEPEVLDLLRAAYRAETVRFPWRRGDVLILDNMLVAHGREPFTGSRRVLVGMAQPVSARDLS